MLGKIRIVVIPSSVPLSLSTSFSSPLVSGKPVVRVGVVVGAAIHSSRANDSVSLGALLHTKRAERARQEREEEEEIGVDDQLLSRSLTPHNTDKDELIHLPQHLLQFEFSHPPMGERAGSRLQTQHDRWIDNTAQQSNFLALRLALTQ